jgi:hypothetical protein
LGSADVAIKSNGTISAVQLYMTYGAGEYSWGTMPTDYNFTRHQPKLTGGDGEQTLKFHFTYFFNNEDIDKFL